LIEGPAELQLISSGEATCTRGKLSANVPPQAKGFRINTPKGTIVDLGTEFGLDVSEASSEVHVFKGEVELHKAVESMKSLKEGQAMAFAAESQLLAANASSFASLNEIHARTALSDHSQFERWQAQSAQLNADPSLKAHFDFQDDESARSLRNHAHAGEDGSIVGASWTTGRWPEKRALEFRNVSDRVRLSVAGETKATLTTTRRFSSRPSVSAAGCTSPSSLIPPRKKSAITPTALFWPVCRSKTPRRSNSASPNSATGTTAAPAASPSAT
jgi:hypothetical protein